MHFGDSLLADSALIAQPPLVSVIIATYNRPNYLRHAIKSVLNGVYQNFEIVVSDDSASPATQQLTESFQDPRIRYRCNQKRLGSAGNHREAVKMAAGKYIGLLNDDDEWESDFLYRLVPIMTSHPEVVIAFTDHWVIDSQGNIQIKATEECTHRFKRDGLAAGLHWPFYKLALIDQSIPMVASLLRTSDLEWDDTPLESSSIYDFWVTYLAARTHKGAWYVPERLARYRVHDRNQTAGGSLVKPAIYVYSRLLADDRLAELRPELLSRLRQVHFGYATLLLKQGLAKDARRHLWAAGPNFRVFGAMCLSYVPAVLRSLVLSASPGQSGEQPIASGTYPNRRSSDLSAL